MNKKHLQNDSSQPRERQAIEVSVIIPVYNAAAFLRQAIESVFDQTLENIEIIIVDDGSTDETSAIARSYGDRVRYLYKENGGIASARNYGLGEARGEFIASLDADDFFILPTKLEKQIAVINQSKRCGLVLTGWKNVDETGSEIENREPWKYASRLDLKDMVSWSPFLPSVMLFRRSVLESIGGFNPQIKIIEDFDIVTRLIIAGYEAKWLPEIASAYRLHGNNITGNLGALEQETDDYLTAFFAQANLPGEVKRIERQIRFSSRIRVAFKYFEAGKPSEMKRCLLKSLEFSDLAHGGALLYWFESFRGYKPKINLFTLLDSKEWRELMDLQLAARL